MRCSGCTVLMNVPKSDEVWKPIIEDSLANLQKKKKDHQDLLEYIGKHTGWNMTSLGRAADLADNLIEIDLFGSTYPDWIKHPRLVGYDFEKMRAEIMSFAEIHQIACADYEPCGGLMAGRWLQDILDKLQKASEGRGPSLVGYASVFLYKNKFYFQKKNKKTPAPAIRLLNHDPNPIDKHVIYQAKLSNKFDTKIQSDGFILLEDFVKIVGSKAYSKWRTACGIA
ncbi:unnamed protein product [Caenorhabditis auriculariae]|uniref:Uncharacterized protein n=1 Tax=Caenorhabditis auriculariae TaxID=2777116 RepID=A0A8S1HEV6_9PELO|nr:unnamed protein product [Caenorhabditis auriculariae]